MPSKISVQPAEEPVTLAAVKDWLKVDYTADDDIITALISAARIAVEDYLGFKLIAQTWEETYDCFPVSGLYNEYAAIQLSNAPLRSVTSIEYQATAGTYTTWASTEYTVHDYHLPAIVTPGYDKLYPDTIKFPEAVKVTYVVGVSANAAGVPELYKSAIKKIVTYWYENRSENVRRMPTDVEWMLNVARILPV